MKKRIAFILLIFFIQIQFMAGTVTRAEDSASVVTVAYFPCYNYFEGCSDDAIKSGYYYEVMQKIANYTGWKYQYVYGKWTDLFQQFKNGEIDLFPGLVYYAKLEEEMDWSSYTIDHEERHYIGVREGADEIRQVLNRALEQLSIDEPDYYNWLRTQYYFNSSATNTLSLQEMEWIRSRKVLNVGYIEDYLPFCDTNSDGEVTGVIIDVVNSWISNVKLQDKVEIAFTSYPTYDAMVEALDQEEIDMAFPTMANVWNSEQRDIMESDPVVYSSVSAVYNKKFTENTFQTVAISEHSAMQTIFSSVYYPNSQLVNCDSAEDCLNAVRDGRASCTFFSGTRAKIVILDNRDESLEVMPLGQTVDFSFAVKRGNSILWSALNTGIRQMNISDMTNNMYNYMVQEKNYNLSDIVRDYPIPVLIVILLFVATLLTAVIIYMRTRLKEMAAKELEDQQLKLIDALSREFLNVYLADLKRDIMQIQKLDGYVTKEISLEKRKWQPYYQACRYYIKGRVHPEDQEMMLRAMEPDTVRNALASGEEYVSNYRVLEKGETHYYQFKYVNLADSDLTIVGFRNVDTIVALETRQREELENALVAAQEADRAKTSFLFNMSHDIRTPMNAITGFIRLLDKYQEDPQKRSDYIQKLFSSSEVLLSIINNVLQMARIESGRTELNETGCDMIQICDSIYSLFDVAMQEKDIRFEKDIQIERAFIWCDETKVQEILINILGNACKYTPFGGKVRLEALELPDHEEDRMKLQIRISDTGIGMDSEFLPSLFDEFSRARNSTESKIQGTGLGMSITKKLVELMGGTIAVESELGKGTTFTIVLPFRTAVIEEMQQENQKSENVPSFEGKRILLAEDNELNAEILQEVLQEIGITADRASDGRECVLMLMEKPVGWYDLILMDIQMPNMNGYEATKAIRKLEDPGKAQIPIIAMTANAFEEDRKNAFDAGMNGHLTKPIIVSDLIEALAIGML